MESSNGNGNASSGIKQVNPNINLDSQTETEPASNTTENAHSSRFQFSTASFKMSDNPVARKASGLVEKINNTDIARINGYLKLANVIGGGIFAILGIVGLFSIHSYGDFLIVGYITALAAGLMFIEYHEKFPSLAEKVKRNLGFMFTAFGRAIYIVAIALLAFTQGWFGCIVGALFLLLAAFNFFLIYKHPAYREAMTQSNSSTNNNTTDDVASVHYNHNMGNDSSETKPPVVV